MKPHSTRIDGTSAQLKPVRSVRLTSPRLAAPVACTAAAWTSRAAFRLRAESGHQLVEVQATQEFHDVIEDAFGRVAVIVNLDRVGMRELAAQDHFALESLDGQGVGAIGQQQFDGGIATEQRVTGAIDDAHAALADFFLEGILAELLELEFRLGQPPFPSEIRIRKNKHPRCAQYQEQGQTGEQWLQNSQWPIGLRCVNLRRNAEAVIGQPPPRSDHLHTPVVT